MATTTNGRLRLATLTLVLTTSGAFGQTRACDLIPDYAVHEAELHRKYTENIRVRMEEKEYDQMGRTGTLEGTATGSGLTACWPSILALRTAATQGCPGTLGQSFGMERPAPAPGAREPDAEAAGTTSDHDRPQGVVGDQHAVRPLPEL